MSKIIPFNTAQQSHAAPVIAEDKAVARNTVIRLRRYIREISKSFKMESALIQVLETHVSTLANQKNRFAKVRLERLNREIDHHRSCCKKLREFKLMCAKILIDIAPFVDACTTLAERCDLLNINQADRGELSEKDGIIELINFHRLEDSASNRGKNSSNFNTPLLNAINSLMVDFLINTEEGKALGNSLFEPGGLFEWVPTYKAGPDGSLIQQAPPLRSV